MTDLVVKLSIEDVQQILAALQNDCDWPKRTTATSILRERLVKAQAPTRPTEAVIEAAFERWASVSRLYLATRQRREHYEVFASGYEAALGVEGDDEEVGGIDEAKYFEVSAGVRYWEDAVVNGEEDINGQIPMRDGDRWAPVIELETGRILDWPQGTDASVYYKVCDDGDYWLQNVNGKRIAKWKDNYVPDDLLCLGETGHGDYIIFHVDAEGMIINWKKPDLRPEQWSELHQN